MPEKTETIVVIESHEQIIIRRSRRVISSQMPTQGDVDRPPAVPITGVTTGCSIGSVSSDATDRFAKRKRRWLGVWWRMVALKGVTVFAHGHASEAQGDRTERQTTTKTRAHSVHIDEGDGGSVFIHQKTEKP